MRKIWIYEIVYAKHVATVDGIYGRCVVYGEGKVNERPRVRDPNNSKHNRVKTYSLMKCD